MEIILTAIDKGGEYPLTHDLNFQSARYEAKHTIVGTILPAMTRSRGNKTDDLVVF